MDITYTVNPYSGPNVNVLVTEQPRVAKLNNTMKRPYLAAHYAKGIAQMMQTVNQVVEQKPVVEVRQERSGLMNSSSEFSEFMYPENAIHTGARKLKVNNMVKEKTLKRYEAAKVNFPKTVAMPNPLPKEPELPKETFMEMPTPQIVPTQNVMPEPVNNMNMVNADTRVGRLERTGEIPTQTVNVLREEDRMTGVINTPTRVERQMNAEVAGALHALVDNEEEKNDKQQLEIGAGAKALDQYNNLIHGNDSSSVANELATAKKKLEQAIKENKTVVVQSANIEDEIQKVRAELEELSKKKAERERQELDRTLKMIEVTQEENLGATRKLTNLQEELAELMRQRDALVNENYSRGGR